MAGTIKTPLTEGWIYDLLLKNPDAVHVAPATVYFTENGKPMFAAVDYLTEDHIRLGERVAGTANETDD